MTVFFILLKMKKKMDLGVFGTGAFVYKPIYKGHFKSNAHSSVTCHKCTKKILTYSL